MGLERDAFGTDDPRLETRSLPIVCQALGSLEPALENCGGSAIAPAAELGWVSAGARKMDSRADVTIQTGGTD